MQAEPPPGQPGAVSVKMTRSMFTSTPPVKPETDEQSRNEELHRSAVEMARKIYMRQQKMADQAKLAQAGQSELNQPSP